jgi:hypothetical protein
MYYSVLIRKLAIEKKKFYKTYLKIIKLLMVFSKKHG